MNIKPCNDSMLWFYEANALNCTFDEFCKAMTGWALNVIFDPDPIAVVATKDGHGHVAAIHGAKVGIRRMRQALDMLKVTKTTVSNHYIKGHALARRLGFKKHHVDKVTHYVLHDSQ